MRRGNSDIRKFQIFSYRYPPRLRGDLVSKCIIALVRHNVQELDIQLLDYLGVTRLPHCLVTSELLTGLALRVDGVVVLPDSISLPRLKYLDLSSFEIDDLKSLNNLLSSCPGLQTLVIRQLVVRAGNELIVSTRKLKHLEISYYSYFNVEVPRIIKLYTPSLTSFICDDFMVRDYCLENISSLVTANIRMRNIARQAEEVFRKRMMVFLMAFHNMKELTLSPDFLQVLSEAPNLIEYQLREFRNLQCLKLEICFDGCCLRGLTWLLRILPCVESLSITSKKVWMQPGFENKAKAVLSGSCILSHLKFIEVREVEGCNNELILLEFVLKNAIVLEEMVLYFCSRGSSTSLNTRKEFSKKIKALPRASSSLIMLFC